MAAELGQPHESGEPEQAGDCIQDEEVPFVEITTVGLVAGGVGQGGVKEQVGEEEEGPGADEEEKRSFVGGCRGVGVAEVP